MPQVLLRQPETKDLVSYVFWMGALSIFGLALMPFGFRMPGCLQMVAICFYYAALKCGEASGRARPR